jgi:hypothetical protein
MYKNNVCFTWRICVHRIMWPLVRNTVQCSTVCFDAFLLHKLHGSNYPLERTCQGNISYLRTVEFARSSTYTKKKNWDQLTVTAGGFNVFSNCTRKAKCCCFMVHAPKHPPQYKPILERMLKGPIANVPAYSEIHNYTHRHGDVLCFL